MPFCIQEKMCLLLFVPFVLKNNNKKSTHSSTLYYIGFRNEIKTGEVHRKDVRLEMVDVQLTSH